MRFVIDMNLTPDWSIYLGKAGHDAVHWSHVGSPTAPDREILSWARENDRVIFTHDLDFGALLALAGLKGPSVVQIRTHEPIPDRVGALFLAAIEQTSEQLRAGALITIDEARNRLRLLPLR